MKKISLFHFIILAFVFNIFNVLSQCASNVPGGNALKFDGDGYYGWSQSNNTGDYCRTTSNVPDQANVTVEAWIWPSKFTTVNNYISHPIVDRTETGYNYSLSCGNITGSQAYANVTFSIVNNWARWDLVTPTAVLTWQTWTHVAATYDSWTNTAKIYVNGVLQVTGTPTLTYTPMYSPISIGAYTASSIDNYFLGIIDEVRIWNSVRTAAEISANRNAIIPFNSSGLIAYYQFDQGVAGADNTAITKLKNSVINGPELTIYNFDRTGTASNFIGSQNTQPGSIQDPSSVCSGTNAISLNLSGQSGNVTKWQYSTDGNAWTDVASSASTTLTVTNLSQNRYYRAVSTSGSCTYTSAPELIILRTAPSIFSFGSSQMVCQGTTAAAINIGASGSDLTYQWYKGTDPNFGNATIIAGATATSYIPPTTAADVGWRYYFCQVTGSCGPVATSSAVWVRTDAPSSVGTFTTTSGSSGLCTGFSTTINLVGTVGTITQWRKSTTNSYSGYSILPGTTSTMNTGTLTQTTWYLVDVVNGVCGSTNQSYQISVGGASTLSGASSVCAGSTTQLTATGTANSTNPWVTSNSGVATVSNTGLVTGVSSGSVTITFTNSFGCQTNTQITVDNVLPSGTISSAGGNEEVCLSSVNQLTFSGTASTFQWQESNDNITFSNISLATGSTYNLNTNGSKYYRLLMATGACLLNTNSIFVNANLSLDFDGQNDAITLTSTAIKTTTSQPFTIEAWISLDAVPSSSGSTIFTHWLGTSSSSQGYYLMINSSNQLVFKRGNNVLTSSTTIPINTWTHVAATYGGSTMRIFINGTQVGSVTSSANLTAANLIPYIGRCHGSTSNIGLGYFNGKIDEFKLWDIDRSSGIFSTSTSSLAYYQDFNQGYVSGGTNTGITTLGSTGSLSTTSTLATNAFALTGSNSNFVNGYGFVLTSNINSSTSTALYCTGTNATQLSVSAIGKSVGYQWYSNTTASTSSATAISGATSSSYTPSTSANGTLYYYASISSCANSLNSNITGAIQVSPSVPGTISGINTVCPGAGTTLTLTGSVGSIQWSSSNTLNGTYSPISGATSTSLSTGNLSATAYYKAQATNSSCPSATTAAYTVSTTPLGTIGAISGPSTATLGGTATYSVTAVTNATSYVWNLPAGMTLTSSANNGASITVNVANNFAGGTLTAQAVGCTNSAVVTRSVNAPSASSLSITTTTSGAPVFCGGTTASFSTTTTSTNSTATYAWTLPTGVSVASGSSLSGSSIDVVFAANYNGGTISVTRVSTTETLSASYSVGAIATPGVITGSSTLCGTSSGTYTIASVSGADSYEWSLPTGMTGTSTNTSINVTWTGSITGNIQVRAVKNSCGTSAWRTLSVASVATPGAITGPTTTCGANSNTISASGTNTTTLNTATYSISAVTGATGYTWTVPTGMAITSGQGTTSINVTITPSSFTSGSVTVVATTSTCTSAVRSLSISSANSTIVGPTDLCGLSQATYSINAPSGATVTWTLADWMSLASGQTLTSNPITVNIGAAPSQQNITASYATSCGTITGSRFVGCSLFTQLENTYCGAALDASQAVLATWIQGATSYRFTISGTGLSTPAVVTNNWRGFNWAQVAGYQLGTAYTVTVAMAFNNSTTFGSEGSSCTVTPTAPPATITTSLESAYCNQSVTASQSVMATWISGATSYRFTISGTGLSTPAVVTNNWRGFNWAQVTGYQLGTAYTVTVAIAYGGSTTFGNEGSSCTVTPTAPPATITTSLESAYCNQSVTANQSVLATWISGATSYRFTISGTGLSTPAVVTNNWRGFNWAQVTGYQLGTAYTVTVAIAYGGSTTFGNEGSSCTVTPTAPPATITTSLESAYCNQSVTANQSVLATWISGATSYRFTISGTGLSTPAVVTNNWRGFNWAQVTGYQLGTAYTVTVAIAYGGSTTFGNEGSSCTVTPTAPPATITTSLESAYCNQSVTANQSVLATWISGATSYRFTISGTGLSTPAVVTNNWRGFNWAQVTGYQLGTSYTVTVAIAYGGSTTFGNEGSSCTVTPTAPPATITTSLESAYCNENVEITQPVLATWIQGATSYRFTITSTVLTTPLVITNNWRGFNWAQVPNPQFDTQYDIVVAIAYGGSTTFGNDGSSCWVKLLDDTQGLSQQDPQLHEEQTEGLGVIESSSVNGLEENQIHNTTWTATATSNPFATSFQIKLNGAEGISTDASFTAQLTDMSGKVYSQATLCKEQLESESFGEQLAPGMYLMTLRQGEELRVIRVVKR